MVDLTRRKTVLGMGLLASGSGAAFTSAAFNNSVDSTSDMQVITAADVSVRKGNNVPTGDTLNTITDSNNHDVDFLNLDQSTDSRVSSNNLDFGGLTGSDVPVAGVNDGVDSNLVIETATGVRSASGSGGTAVVFENIIEIVNEGDTTINDIGISYGASGAYGNDVDGSTITEDIVKEIYQFIVQPSGVSNISSKARISPDHTNASDDPENTFTLKPGETAQINLENHNHNYRGKLQSASSNSGNPWNGASFNTIDLLDTITVGSGYTV